jgi:UDP-N-acetylglucosamine--N-acetylmuramyl-(pentapeptide) pyrophosphoryl-undecaprenol N-acetylglucosamine transferase
MINIAFTGGGTAGHIYPGLAVVEELKRRLSDPSNNGRKFRIFWIGSSEGMDRGLVEAAGIEFFGISSGRLRRYFTFKTLVDLFKVLSGYFAARKILKKEKPCLIFSKGGFVSVPPCAAAASLGIPVYTHESDLSPGLATRMNARYVLKTGGKIFTAYEDTAGFFKEIYRGCVTLSGNPVRNIFNGADAERGRRFLEVGEDVRIILVLGGSQGAQEINELIRASCQAITDVYTIVHQTGINQSWDMHATEKYKPFPFIREELPHIMAAAELIIGRSGAGIWEWAVLGKPMLLIPLRGSGTRGDQEENARYFQEAGAAQVLSGDDVTAKSLTRAVLSFAQNHGKRTVMAASSLKIGKREGTGFIAQTLMDEIKRLLGDR